MVAFGFIGLFSLSSRMSRRGSDEYTVQGQWRGNMLASPVRVDEFLFMQAPEIFPTKTAAKKTVRRGLVDICFDETETKVAETTDHVNGQSLVTSYVRSKPPVVIMGPTSCRQSVLGVLYEDEHLAIVDKAQGVSVFSSQAGTERESLYTQLLAQLSPTGETSPLRRPQPVHRLDTETGGLLIVAKTKPALQLLSAQFSERQITKEYTAIVANMFSSTEPTRGAITEPLNGQTAHTEYELIETYPRPKQSSQLDRGRLDGLSLLRVNIFTGRTHQIRRHLDMLTPPHPVLFDKNYWFSKGNRQSPSKVDEKQEERFHCLWSTRLKFAHPITKVQMDVALPEPPAIRTTIQQWLSEFH